MTKGDSSRIQSSQAKAGKDTTTGTFAARAQSTADRSANAGVGAGTPTTPKTASGGAPKSGGGAKKK